MTKVETRVISDKIRRPARFQNDDLAEVEVYVTPGSPRERPLNGSNDLVHQINEGTGPNKSPVPMSSKPLPQEHAI